MKPSDIGGGNIKWQTDFRREVMELIKPYNPTDPVVVFDPTFEKPGVVRDYVGETPSDKLDPEGETPHNSTYVRNPVVEL